MNMNRRHDIDISGWTHRHHFTGGGEATAERRARLVVALTLVMMGLEIAVGLWTNSMALLADGFHMATHGVALGVAAFAYWYMRRHADDPRYSFGAGKAGALAGFTSALILAVVALGMIRESAWRLTDVQVIDFDEALAVAALGLAVNLLSALILGGSHHGHKHDEHEHHEHDHGHHHGGHDHDINMRGAYLHVLADALTSVLAIVALVAGKFWGWWWLDPTMGFVGGVVILVWGWGLANSAAGVLLDRCDDDGLAAEVRTAIEGASDARIADLHLWRVGPGHWAAVISLVARTPQAPADYRALLAGVHGLSHITIEVHGY